MYVSLQYDCNRAPLELNNIAYSWWNDRSGSARYFWSGVENIDEGTHTCQCGIDGNCVDPSVKCNCDSLSPSQLFDSGISNRLYNSSKIDSENYVGRCH